MEMVKKVLINIMQYIMKKRYNHIFLTALILFIVLYTNSQALELANSKKTTAKYYSFIQNKGQWDDEVLFLAEMRGVNVWVCKASIKFEYYGFEYFLK